MAEFEPMLVDGEWVAASTAATFDTIDPSSGKTIGTVAKGGAQEVDSAVRAAEAAFADRGWRRIDPADRSRMLHQISLRILELADELAKLESLDSGKPIRQARNDVAAASRYFEYYAGIADKITGSQLPLRYGFVDYTVREPVGVSAQIVPWNSPLHVAARGVAPAIATGCTVVLKPSSEAPLTLLRLGQIGLDCGLPPGVLNVISGTGSELGASLASHPGVNQITFTGSVEVGSTIAHAAADNVIPVVLELGGKSPQIVFADADVEMAADAICTSITNHAGQICSAGSRMLADESIYSDLVNSVAERFEALTIGPGLSDADLGPLVSARQLERVEQYVRLGASEGARLVTGGARATDGALSDGFFMQPTLFSDVAPEMHIGREEVFGPVLAVTPFEGLDEAVAKANDSLYGLVAGVWTRDISKALQLADELRVGQVFINTFGVGTGAEIPFGGFKRSGYGREKGLDAIASYTETKNVCIRFA